MHTYGTLPSGPNNTKITFTGDTGNGTSNFNTAGVITLEIPCQWTDRDTNTPALYSAYPSDANYILTNATQEQQPAGLCKITLTYTAASTSVPDTSYSEQTSQVEIDIRQHPNFNDWIDDWDADAEAFKVGTSKYGIKSYIKGTTTVTKTEYFADRPSHRFANVGKLQAPGGDYTGANNYLILGSSRALQGKLWTIVTIYQYSADEYNSDIYSAV